MKRFHRGGSRINQLSKGLVRERGKMNKTETKYANWLTAAKLAGEIAEFWFEPFSLRISACEAGQPARYTPDFMILMPDGRTFVDDVKTARGFDDIASLVRIKVAASEYPLWVFRIVRPASGGFETQEI
jgi:hypothetical protein